MGLRVLAILHNVLIGTRLRAYRRYERGWRGTIRSHYVNIASGSFFGVVFCSVALAAALCYCWLLRLGSVCNSNVLQRVAYKNHDKKTDCNTAEQTALVFRRDASRAVAWGFILR